MTGANYTGGKRNVARTRFRDSTRRVQKNHFGRRRLGILSRDLVNGGAHSRTEKPNCGMSGIQLEHAHRDISRLLHPSPTRETGAVGAYAPDDSSAALSSSNKGSTIIHSSSRIAHTLDDGSYSSLRAEMDRVLEFSRKVGLCNYTTSPKQGALASPTSYLDSEPERPSSRQQRHEDSPTGISDSSGGRRTKAYIGHASQVPENPQTPQTRTQLHSLRETVSPTPDCEYLEYYVSPSPAKYRSTVGPQLGQETGSPGLLGRDPYTTDPLPPSFDALAFSTSPLPPSSPLLSSATYGSLLSLCQLPPEAEMTILNSDRISLPSIVSGSYDVGSSSRYGGSRHITLDLASTSPSRHLPCTESGLVPRLLASSSKADIIPDLLTCNNPWNVIGDMLDLPPIPSADATYFSNIPSFNTHGLLSRASSSSEQVDMREPLSPARDEGTRSRTVHSDGDLLIRPDPSQLSFAREATRCASSPLVSRDPPTKRVFSPAPPLCSSLETRILSLAEPHQLSPPRGASTSVPSEAPRSVLVSWTLSPSPRTPDGKSGLGSESSPALVKTLSPPPFILTPRRPTSPAPKDLTLLSRSPGIASTTWDAVIEFDPTTLISKVPTTQATASREQRPRLECPDLFQDEEDILPGIF